ncbi:SIMPL domain-containing protein [Flavobacterium sediminilitoris]|uniref:SIMPL domain-containing protein n=1 Tax=Flavobacterium sediminilitoris TaxID=2024526 RepID=A0ABY4HQF9_9FLAO|nr:MULTISPECIES: SIMPL domain-containing protein [Flavobacterium]UOX33744.1 SIMPL domain-containing protein [Flavobacterium sediminilitoris]
MKRIILVLTLITVMAQAQDNKLVPQISVSGEGKVKVTPDEVLITVGVENTGKDATEVKKKNDETVDLVIKAIKKRGIPTSDFQSNRVSLFKNYDYATKKNNYVANQTIVIHLKDLSKYDAVMMDLVDSGINQIQGVQFKSSKMEQYEAEARKKAVLDAKKKAEDYVSALNQKVGKAVLISDSSNASYYPQPMYKNMAVSAEMDMGGFKETLAVGEIDITATVSVSFILE